MINPENRLFCRLDGLTSVTREQQRMLVMAELGLLEPESVPVFEEATQTAANFLDVPICILGLMEPDRLRFKSAVGLSRLGLMNELANSRQIPRVESFCAHVVDSHQALVIDNTLEHPAFATSTLTQQYGIRAYLGVPLITSNGQCLGTLAVMDLSPHSFNIRDIQFLELTARWSVSEYERRWAGKSQPGSAGTPSVHNSLSPVPSLTQQLRVELLGQLTQELRSPLTSVMGMASVLSREIYGPLNRKQQEYLEIVHHSGQYLLSLVNEILELADLGDAVHELNLTSVDIEMLCQQAINMLEQAAHRREQQIRLSVEPGRRIWLLDKDKIRQMLYHLMFSLLQSSTAGSIIRLHVSRKGSNLSIAVWVSHPWLGEGIPYFELPSPSSLGAIEDISSSLGLDDSYEFDLDEDLDTGNLALQTLPELDPREEVPSQESALEAKGKNQKSLGILLSNQLAEMHGGQILLQGSAEAGYRYVISLPQRSDSSDS